MGVRKKTGQVFVVVDVRRSYDAKSNKMCSLGDRIVAWLTHDVTAWHPIL